MNRLLPLALAAALLVTVSVAWAQGSPRVNAYIDPPDGITEDTPIRFVVEIEGAGNAPLGPPRVSNLINLRVLSGPQTNYESAWRNGRFSSKTRLIYRLQATSSGTAEIPAINVTVGDQVFPTRPIRFDVAKSRGGVPPPVGMARSPLGRSRTQREVDVFIRAELGSDAVWVGESVPLSVSLYATEEILSFDWSQEPALANYWVEDLDVDPNAEAYRETVEGRKYNVFPMKRKVLIPQTSGEFEIEPYTMQVRVRQRSSDPFDLFTFGRGTSVLRRTQPLVLKVRALPTEGRPEDFSGAVGSYELQAALDRQEASVNDAVALKATVQGAGFLGSVDPPSFDAPSDLKIFPPEVNSVTRGSRGQMISRKIWEWILVPLSPGEIGLSEISFNYFDPTKGSYQVASVSLLPLIVQRGGHVEDAPVARGDVAPRRRDLAFIKPLRGELRLGSSRVQDGRTFLVILGLPLLWVPLVVVVSRRRAKLQQNLGLVRSRRARSRALKRLRAAEKMDETSSAEFHEEVARALVEYIADGFDRSAAGLTYEMADELLASRGLDPELRRRFRSCLESCDFARFVPASGKTERRHEVLKEANEILERLERER